MRIVFITFALSATLFAGMAQAQACPGCVKPAAERTCGNEVPAVTAEIKLLPEWTVASISATGPYAGAGAMLNKVLRWVATAKAPMTGKPFGVYHDDPTLVPPESTRYMVAVPVAPSTVAPDSAGITIRRWGGFQVASTLHTGPYDGLTTVYAGLAGWIAANGWQIAGAPAEFYLNRPGMVPDDSLATEVAFPVRRSDGGY